MSETLSLLESIAHLTKLASTQLGDGHKLMWVLVGDGVLKKVSCAFGDLAF